MWLCVLVFVLKAGTLSLMMGPYDTKIQCQQAKMVYEQAEWSDQNDERIQLDSAKCERTV